MRNAELKILLILVILFSPFACNGYEDNYPEIAKIEKVLFGFSYPDIKVEKRISSIEIKIFGKAFSSESLFDRTERLKKNVFGTFVTSDQEEQYNENLKSLKPNIIKSNGYENLQTKTLTPDEFVEILFGQINNERSFKGMLPLEKDETATRVAQEQIEFIFKNGQLTYFNDKHQCPDERYTLAGGTGAITEVIKGFEEYGVNNIKTSGLLAKQLVQAISVSPDDAAILFAQFASHLGVGFGISKDKKKFVAILEIINKGGSFFPVKPNIKLGEKLLISGKVNKPYNFKAVAIGYAEPEQIIEQDESYGFDFDRLKPFFPPQSYVAFGDTTKTNFLKVAKSIGILGAIAGAPFTGGATAVLAPPLFYSIQNCPAREVPLKGGVKSNSKGEFVAELPLNYNGKTGLYFVSVLADIKGINYPVVVSRRTVRVESPLEVSWGSKEVRMQEK